VTDPTKVAAARELYDSQQQTVAEIAEMLDVSVATIYRHLGNGEAA
jgi:AcrR family transcriptional regulator